MSRVIEIATGARGPGGPQGIPGLKGDKGLTGNTGLNGDKGDTGTPGGSDADTATRLYTGPLTQAAVAAVPLPAATGVAATDTAALQSALDKVQAAQVFSGALMRVRGMPGSDYVINQTLTIRSSTVLELYGCKVTEAPGSNCQMIRNAAYRGSGEYDHDMHIRGGVWDRGANGAPTARDTLNIVFHRFANVSVEDVTFKSTASKWAITFGDGDTFWTERIRFDDANADGIHVLGPAKNGIIRDTYGTCGDDLVALVCTDYTDYELTPGGGSITDVCVYNTHPDATMRNAVRLVGSRNFTLDRILVDGVFGTATFNGVNIRGDDSFPTTHGGTIGTIWLRNLDVDVPADQAVVSVGEPVDKLDIDGIVVKASSGVSFKSTPGFPAEVDLRIKTLSVRNVHSAIDAPSRLVTVDTGCTVDRLLIDGVTGVLDSTKADGLVLNHNGTIGLAQISRVNVQGGSSLVTTGAAAVMVGGELYLDNISMTGVGFGVRHQADFVLEVVASVVNMHGVSIVRVSGAGANAGATLRGAGLPSTVSTIARTGTQKLRAIGAEIRADVSTLTPNVGDICHSTVASAVCGVGPAVFSNDSTWRPLSGLVTRGTPSLVAGTVSIADTRVALNTEIKLNRRTISGTPGALFVSALTPGTGFTISSTSSTDAGQIEYVVERY